MRNRSTSKPWANVLKNKHVLNKMSTLMEKLTFYNVLTSDDDSFSSQAKAKVQISLNKIPSLPPL